MRIGYAFGSETLISTLEAVKNSYNSYTMDSLALAVGEASIRDEAYFRETCRKVAATRDRAADELRALGFEVTPSLANFLFATHPKKAAPKFSPPCAKRVSSSGISNCRASTITCASRSARTSRWTRSLLR